MAKFTPKNLNSGFNDTDSLNENFAQLETLSDTWLSRDGTAPNTMNADIDMSGNDILNLGGLTLDGFSVPATGISYNDDGNTYVLGADVQLALDATDTRLVSIGSIETNIVTTEDDETLVMISGGSPVSSIPLGTAEIQLAARTQNNSTASNALCQLNPDGKVPVGLLPSGGINLIGFWNPITLGPTPPVLPGNFVNGDYFLFSAEGPMSLLTDDNQTPHTVTVFPGDTMIALLGSDGFADGWYYLDNSNLAGIGADQVTFDPTGNGFTATTVQGALEEVDPTFFVKTGGDTMTGQLVLPGGGTGFEAATSSELVDGDSLRVLKAGDTMSGQLTLPGTGTGLNAASVGQFEAGDALQLSLTGGVLSGNVTRSGRGIHMHMASSSNATGGQIRVQVTTPPTGGLPGDIWLIV